VPKAGLKPGHQAQEIGAAIVGAWLKVLPPMSANITSMIARNPLKIRVDTNAFATDDVVALRNIKGLVTRNIKVGTVTDGTGNQVLDIVDLNDVPIIYPPNEATFQGGMAAIVGDLLDQAVDLSKIFGTIVDVKVNVIFDQPGEINVVIPTLPEGVLTRADLLEYLRDYHTYGQGRHYHDELATAVLFGCR
jgi:hypothetical protein